MVAWELGRGNGRRSSFITDLTPPVERRTTDETVTTADKTEILIGHEDRNAFVAERGMWSGVKAFAVKADQMLGYLTWCDSKAALVLFVPDKDISKPAIGAQAAIAAPATHVKRVDELDGAWTDHILHFPDDPGRGVRVGLMLFHIPK